MYDASIHASTLAASIAESQRTSTDFATFGGDTAIIHPTKDAWERELIMLCGDKVPAWVPDNFGELSRPSGFAVLSKGPDGAWPTADDITSFPGLPHSHPAG